MDFIKKTFFSSARRAVTTLVIAALLLSLPITYSLLSQRQDVRQRASETSKTYKVDYVQGALGRSEGSQTATASFYNTSHVVPAGNFLAITISSKGTDSAIKTVTDNYGNTYTKVFNMPSMDNKANISLWYTKVTTANSDFNITATTTGPAETQKIFMNVQELSGVDQINPLTSSSTNAGIDSSVNSGTLTVPVNSYTISGFTFSEDVDLSSSFNTTFPQFITHQRNLNGQPMSPMLLLTTNGASSIPDPSNVSREVTFNWPQNVNWAGFIAGFRADSTPPPTNTPTAAPTPTSTPKTPPCGRYGDINGDSLITDQDKTDIMRIIAGFEGYSEDQKKYADLNGQNGVNSADSVLIARFLAGLDLTFPICALLTPTSTPTPTTQPFMSTTFEPTNASHPVGEQFSVDVVVNAGQNRIDVAKINIGFSDTMLTDNEITFAPDVPLINVPNYETVSGQFGGTQRVISFQARPAQTGTFKLGTITMKPHAGGYANLTYVNSEFFVQNDPANPTTTTKLVVNNSISGSYPITGGTPTPSVSVNPFLSITFDPVNGQRVATDQFEVDVVINAGENLINKATIPIRFTSSLLNNTDITFSRNTNAFAQPLSEPTYSNSSISGYKTMTFQVNSSTPRTGKITVGTLHIRPRIQGALSLSYDTAGLELFAPDNPTKLLVNNVIPASFTVVNPTDTPTTAPTTVICALKPRGDANCDGLVNPADFIVWKSEYITFMNPNQTSPSPRKGDFNNDSITNPADFIIWKNGYLDPLVPHAN